MPKVTFYSVGSDSKEDMVIKVEEMKDSRSEVEVNIDNAKILRKWLVNGCTGGVMNIIEGKE